MRLGRLVLSTLIALPLLAAGGADSAELNAPSRLVPGGIGTRPDMTGTGFGETRIPLTSTGNFSLGAVSDNTRANALPFATPRGALAVGGYVAYGIGAARLSSSLKSDGANRSADLSATYGGALLGTDSVAAFSLGVRRADNTSFSPNAQQLGASFTDPYHPASDINMSLSLIHQVSPAFSVGGVAAASRPSASESGLMLGAGLGYRF
ncbi:MAG: hypothetical protein HY055_10950 [Magnetospirillum sp.]|nr:hypothetical protein [Magnetospirillum sp.]